MSDGHGHKHHNGEGHGGHKKNMLKLFNNSKGCFATSNVLISILALGVVSLFYFPQNWLPNQFPNVIKQYFNDEGRQVWGKSIFLRENNSSDYSIIVINGSLAKSPVTDILKRIRSNTKSQYSDNPVIITCKTPREFTPKWETKLPGSDFQSITSLKYTMDDKNIYFMAENILTALDKITGQIVWTKTLAAMISEECTQCIHSKGDMVLILTEDKLLSTINTKDGNFNWQLPLGMPETTQSGFVFSQNQLIVMDENKDKKQNLKGLFIYDVNTGKQVKKIIPRLSKNSKNVQLIHLDDFKLNVYFVLEENGKMILQSSKISDGIIAWSKKLPDFFVMNKDLSFSEQVVINTDKHLYLTGRDKNQGNVLLEVNIANGNIQTILNDKNYVLSILFKKNQTLFLNAKNTKTQKSEIWALDENSGKIIWKHSLEAQNLFLNGMKIKVVPENGQFTTLLVRKGIAVIQVLPNTNRVKYELLDMKDGRVILEKTTQVENLLFTGFQVADDKSIFISVFFQYELNLETGELIKDWP